MSDLILSANIGIVSVTECYKIANLHDFIFPYMHHYWLQCWCFNGRDLPPDRTEYSVVREEGKMKL